MKAKVSVLGCGWLGKPLAIEMIKNGHSVKGSTTTKEKISELKASGIEPHLIDIGQIGNISEFLKSSVLVVAITSKSVDAYKDLIKKIEASEIRKVIYISSTSVYRSENKTVTEDSRLTPSVLLEIEELFKQNGNFECTILRFAGLFGEDRKPGRFFKPNMPIKNPDGFVNLIHQDDCIQIINKIISTNCWQITLNACADSHPTRKDFYTKELAKTGNSSPEFKTDSSYKYKIVSSKKLKTRLNYEFKHNDLMKF